MAAFRRILNGPNNNNSKGSEAPLRYYPEDIIRITYLFENPDAISSFASRESSESHTSCSSSDITSEASSEFSSMATCTDNPGPGRTLDTHVFQPLGRLVEIGLATFKRRKCAEKHPAEESVYDTEGDTGASSDFSTMATRTNNPGPGRIIDTHVFQPCGRYIERILTNIEQQYFRTPQWNADHIMRYIEFPMVKYHDTPLSYEKLVLSEVGEYHTTGIDYVLATLNANEWSEWCHNKLRPFNDALFRTQSITVALRRLLVQARCDKRNLRIEAQKQLWRLCRHYEYMLIMIDIFVGKQKLVQDADVTFMRCQFEDLDNNFQFHAKWTTFITPNGHVNYSKLKAASYTSGDPELRNIMKIYSQNHCVISSAQVHRIMVSFFLALHGLGDIPSSNETLMISTLEDIYICSITIYGLRGNHFCIESLAECADLDGLSAACKSLVHRRVSSIKIDLVSHVCILISLVIPDIIKHDQAGFSQMMNCITEALMTKCTSVPYISINNYMCNVRETLTQRRNFDNISSKHIAYPFEDYICGHIARTSNESQRLNRKWADEEWEWRGITNSPGDNGLYYSVPFRKREENEHPDCGTLRSYFDYKIYSIIESECEICANHKIELQGMIGEWLKDLDDFSISHSEYLSWAGSHRALEWWDNLSANSIHFGKYLTPGCCTFCKSKEEETRISKEEETRMIKEKRRELAFGISEPPPDERTCLITYMRSVVQSNGPEDDESLHILVELAIEMANFGLQLW